MAMRWWWAYAPYLDEPEKQAESALARELEGILILIYKENTE